MQDISNHRDKLNPKFLEGVERFETLLKLKLAPKPSITSGEKITGEGNTVQWRFYLLNSIKSPGTHLPN